MYNMKKGKKGGTKCSLEITNGCGKGKSCSVDLYIQPYASTKEQFNQYADDRGRQLKEDSTSK